jgi:hypothetical protein
MGEDNKVFKKELKAFRRTHTKQQMFITFIYKIKGIRKKFYGKYDSYHCMLYNNEGLDNEVKSVLVCGLNKYRSQKGMSIITDRQVTVGILSFCQESSALTWSTDYEIKCFDFYFQDSKFTSYGPVYYINGKELV